MYGGGNSRSMVCTRLMLLRLETYKAETWGFHESPSNPRTCIAFWPGEKELNLHIKHTTLEHNDNQLFLNLGCVSHE